MSELDALKSKPAAKRILKDISFDFEGSHLAYTNSSQGGACSLVNDPIMLKSLMDGKQLDSDQEELLTRMGHDISAVGKSLSTTESNTPSSSSEDVGGEENINVNKESDNTMSTETLERIAQLEKALATSEAVNSISGYGFEADLNKAVAGAIANLEVEDKEAITKAFDALIAAGEAKVEAEVEKAKVEDTKEESELAKAMSEEVGVEGEAEVEDIAKSLADRVKAVQKAEKESK